MKKVIIFLLIIIALFAALGVVNFMSNKQMAEGNPYGKTTLHPDTIKQLNDPVYQNQILPDELAEKLANKEEMFVYYYSPSCVYCQQTTPILVPLTEELQLDVKKHNLLEFEQSWHQFGIQSTPTLVYYKDGQEVSRLVGGQTEESLRQWFSEVGK